MATINNRHIGKLLLARSMPDMLSVARRYGMLHEDKIDLRGQSVRFDHQDLDLSQFLFEETHFGGSRLVNCSAERTSFKRCKFLGAYITAKGSRKVSFAHAVFDDCYMKDCYFGPRTLDLTAASFTKSQLIEVTFMLAKLGSANFSQSNLVGVRFRKAILDNANFRSARLNWVLLEGAELNGADFTGAEFHNMDFWGDDRFISKSKSDIM